MNDTEENAALANNRINVTENNLDRIVSKRIYNNYKYILESNHTYTGNVLITSDFLWSNLDESYHSILNEIISDSIIFANEYAHGIEDLTT